MKTRKTLGKLLIVALFVVLFAALLTVSASAATHDVTDEATLTEALTNAAAGDTINVTADVTTTQQLTIDRSLTFSGNGTLSAGGINVVDDVDLKFGGSLTLELTNSILYTDANAGGSLTIGDNAKFYFNSGCGIQIKACSPTVTIKDSAVFEGKAGQHAIYISHNANPTIYFKDNATLTTKGDFVHLVRISEDSSNPASANLYFHGSTTGKGLTLNVSRAADVRKGSSANLEFTGKIDFNLRKGIIRATSPCEEINVDFTADATFTSLGEAVFYIGAKKGKLNITGDYAWDLKDQTFITLAGSSTEQGVVATLTGNFNITNCYSFFYTEKSTTASHLIVQPRENNTTDKLVFSGFRLFNLRDNSVANARIDTNKIEVTTTERISYGTACTDIDLTFKASDITFTTLGTGADTDCFFLFNGYASGKKANINFDGKVSMINASIGTDYEKNPTHFGCHGTHAETVVLGLTLRNMDVANINWLNWEDSTEFSYGTPIVLENCTGTLTIDGTFTAPQIHVKGGSVSTVITGTANLSGIDQNPMAGGLLYSNGAIGSITISGNGVLNHKEGHGVEINGCNTTLTVQDSGSIISSAADNGNNSYGNDREIIYVLNSSNATIYIKDNATLFSPNGKWGHAVRVGTTDNKNPSNATVYMQGSTAEGDEGLDIDAARIFDVRTNNSITFEVTGKADLNTDVGIIGCHGATKFDGKFLGNNVKMTQGSEHVFNINAKEINFVLEGDHTFTIRETAGDAFHFMQIQGTSSNANFKHTIKITGNIKVNFVSANTAHYSSCFYVASTGATPVEITVNAREGNTTDKFVFDGDRLFNIRKNVKFTCNIKTNEVTTTTTERVAYTVDTAAIAISIEAPVINHTSDCNGDALYLFDKNANTNIKNVSLTLKGAVTATCAAFTDLIFVEYATDFTLNVIGSLTTSVENRVVMVSACTGKATVKLEGDINIPQTTDIVYIKGASSADVDLIGNFNVTASGSAVYLENVPGKSTVDIAPREGNTTDKFYYSSWRLLNFRDNTDTVVNISGNDIKLTLTSSVLYSTNIAANKFTINATKMVVTGCKENVFFYNTAPKNVELDIFGNIDITAGSAIDVIYVGAGTANVEIEGASGANDTGFVVKSANRLSNMRANVVGNLTVTGKGSISVLEKLLYHVNCSTNIVFGGSITATNNNWAFIYINNDDSVERHSTITLKDNVVMMPVDTALCADGLGANVVMTVEDNAKIEGPGYLIYYASDAKGSATIKDNATLTSNSNAIYFCGNTSGSVTITDSVKISGSAIVLEGTGDIDLTVSGTPTLTLTSKYNGIQHKATGDAKINLSGVWSTNKTIYLSGGKKNISVSGADTVLTLGGSGFYAEKCETTLTVQGGTINYTAGDAMFIAVSGGKMDVTVNSGTLSSAKYFGHAYTASTLNLTVNGGTLSSGSWFLYYGKNGDADQTATGTVTYNGGTINVKDHNIVNFGNKKVDFTMTGGTVTAPNSFVYYENQTATDAEMSTIRVTGGSHNGGHFYVVKKAAANITVGGNANLNITSGWAFRFQGTATGSVTLEGNSAITVNDHGFVNNSAGKVDFTIKDNASLTSTKHTTVYYGGSYADGVVNEVKILGGTLTAVQQAVTFPGSGGQFKLTMSGGSLNTTSDGMAFGGTFTGNINISGGSIYSTSNNLYFNCNGTYTVNISGGSFTCPSNDCIELVNKDTTTLNMTISGGTFHTLGTNYPIVFTGKNNTLTITGGSFIADNAHAALHVAQNATATVYGGYFEGGALCAARACDNGTLNIYGGEFYYNASVSTGGMPIRSGTTGTVGTVNIYGGNYRTDGTAPIFYCINDISHLTVYGGYNAYGGGTLIVNDNKTNGGTPTRGMPIGSIVDSDSIYMVEGAAVRIVEGSSGLRFKAKINASSYNFIAGIADAGSIRFGTLIAPVDYVQQADRFTKAELDRLGLAYLNLPANAGLKQLEDGSYEISAAITNIKEANRGREFAAVAYMIYTVDGHEVITYATFRENKNARSIETVARLALKDGRRYNENQLAILNALAPTTEAPVIDLYLIAGQSNAAGSTRFSEAFRDSDPAFTEGYPNIYYSGTAAGGTAYVSKNFVEIELAKAGFGGNPTSGMGAELGMAKALSQYYNEETGRTAAIVKYGYGGTALADSVGGQNFPEGSWCPPSWLAEHGKKDEQKSGGLYRAFVAQIQSSINDYRAMGYEVNIVAAYWMQGESDRNNKNYAAMFEAWVNDLRADVYKLTRDSADKKLPVLVGEISYSYNPGDMHLNAPFIQMQNQMAEQIDNLYVIHQSPLATANTRSDTGHWSCDDMLLIGQMVATTALNELVLGDEDEKLEMPYLVGTPVAEVYDAEGTLLGTYSSFSWAINTAPAGATVKLLDDLTIYGPLGINNPNKITVDGGDFMIDVRSDLGEAMKLIATDLTLKDFNIIAHAVAFNGATDTVWGLQTYNGAKLVWNGGSFEAESIGIVLNDAAVVQLHNVDVSVRNGVEGHSAAIYMGSNNADLWVNGGTVTGIGKAEAIRAATGYVTVSGGAVIVGGTNTDWAISQRSGEGYLAIGNDVTVTGNILNNGDGYLAGEDVVVLPSPEVPEEPAPEVPVEPAPEVPEQPAPEVPVEPAPELPVEPAPEITIDPAA